MGMALALIEGGGSAFEKTTLSVAAYESRALRKDMLSAWGLLLLRDRETNRSRDRRRDREAALGGGGAMALIGGGGAAAMLAAMLEAAPIGGGPPNMPPIGGARIGYEGGAPGGNPIGGRGGAPESMTPPCAEGGKGPPNKSAMAG